MKTDKLLLVLTRNAPNRSGRALPLPKHQGPEQSQTGTSLKKSVPKDLEERYNNVQSAIMQMMNNPPQAQNPGMAPKDVMAYIKDRPISTLMKENPSLGTTCEGPYCTTAASTAFRLTYPNAAPLPTIGGNTFRDQILNNPAFGVTSNDIYSNLHPGSYLQEQTLEEYYEDEEGNTKQRSKPSYQSLHNMYIYDVENLPSGRKRIHTVQNTGNMYNPESTQITKEYDVDKEGNIYSQDSDHIVIESASENAANRPLLVYYKGNDIWSNPEMNNLLKEREGFKKQILDIDPDYFTPEKPTRYDVDYQPGQFLLPESFSNDQEGRIVPRKDYKEWIDLRESKVPEIVNQVNNPEYKKMIMRDYNISDAEYNAMVKTMIGQYMMESQGGTDWQSGFRVPENKGLAKLSTALGADLSKKSVGPFQINYSQLGEKTKEIIPKRGVSNKSRQEFIDFMYDPVKSSDVAMRYLAENMRMVRNLANQEGERQNMTPANYVDYLPYVMNQQGWLRRTDEESQSRKGSILGEGTNAYVQGIKDYADMLLDYVPVSNENFITNPPTIRRDGGPLPKAQTGLYYKDKAGVLRFRHNNQPVATGKAESTVSPIEAALAVATGAPLIPTALSFGSKTVGKSGAHPLDRGWMEMPIPFLLGQFANTLRESVEEVSKGIQDYNNATKKLGGSLPMHQGEKSQPGKSLKQALLDYKEGEHDNPVEFFDFTGLTSWDDAARAHDAWKKSGSAMPSTNQALDMFGAVPALGKLSYLRYLDPNSIKNTYKFFNWQKAASMLDYLMDSSNTNKKYGGPTKTLKVRIKKPQ